MGSPSCFISYCHDNDGNVPEECVDEIVRKLRVASGGIKFFYDKENAPGTNIDEYMREIYNVDTILVICSPKYVQKTQKYGERIYTEFQYMLDRYRKLEEIRKYSLKADDLSANLFEIIPIIINADGVSQDYRAAYPDCFQRELNLAFREYFYYSPKFQIQVENIKSLGGERKKTDLDKKLIDTEKSWNKNKASNESIIKTIVGKTITIFSQRPIANTNIPKEKRIRRLIANTKAESVMGSLGSLFCETKFYKDLKEQTKTVFVGRKGSGKTETIKYFCSENRDLYKGAININANDINLKQIINTFNSNISTIESNIIKKISSVNIESIKSDIKEMFSINEFLRYTWLGFIYLCSIYRIACEDLSEFQSNNFLQAKKYMSKLLSPIVEEQKWVSSPTIQKPILKALFQNAFISSFEFYDHIIDKARTASYPIFQTDIVLRNTPSNFITFLLGKGVRKSFANTISHCTKKIFISLDGFDNVQQEVKIEINKDSIKEALDFESLWILSLVNVVNQIKNATFADGIYELEQKIDICLMLPFDKYMQMTYYRRDGFVYRDLITAAIYKGLDLYDIYLKRIYNIVLDKSFRNITQNERSRIVLELHDKYKKLPTDINVRLKNGNVIKYPLFLYILRYTFWRPRDIIDYIGAVFKALFESDDNKLDAIITEETIKESVRLCSNKIVLKIMEEFREVWVNIVECISKFNYQKAVMSYDEFAEFIFKNAFVINLVNGVSYTSVNDIIKYLYEIGIIGLILSNKNRERLHLFRRQNQVFYSGRRPLDRLGREEFKENMIFLNPTLFAHCNSIIDTDEVIGIENWIDLEHLDARIDYDYLNNPV